MFVRENLCNFHTALKIFIFRENESLIRSSCYPSLEIEFTKYYFFSENVAFTEFLSRKYHSRQCGNCRDSLSHFLQKFRESNVFTKGISKLVHLTNFFSSVEITYMYVRKFTLTHFFPKISWKQRSLKHFFSFFQCGNYRNLLRTLSAFGRQHFLFVNGILWNFPSLKFR